MLLVCLFVVFLCALRVCFDRSLKENSLPDGLMDMSEITLNAKVAQKDGEKIFLSSIVILEVSPDQEDAIPINKKITIKYSDLTAPDTLKIGQQVVLRGTFSEYQRAWNPGEADYAEYYASINVCGRLKQAKVLKAGENYRFFSEMIFELRVLCRERLYRVFPPKEASVMTALLTGDRSGLDEDLEELYRRNGIIHILSISGLHVTIVGLGIFSALRRAGISIKASSLAGGAMVIFYGMFTGMGITVLRAAGMYLLKLLSSLTGRTYDMPTAAGFLLAVLSLKNPLYLTNAGFLLSFGAVCGAGIVYPVLFRPGRKAQRRAVSSGKPFRDFLQKLADKIADCLKQSIFVSLSVTAAVLPVLLYFYYEVPVFSAMINILVLPFMSLLLITGIFVMGVPELKVLGVLDSGILTFYEAVCRFFDRIPFSVWNPGCPGKGRIFGYYLVLVTGLIAFVKWDRGREEKGKGTDKKSADNGGRDIGRFCPVILLTILVIIMGFPRIHGTEVYFLDVGQGDGIVLITPHDKVYLFDFGSTSRREVGKYVLKPFLRYKGIGRIDVITVSHEDADHINGILELLENRDAWGICVGQVFLPDSESADFTEILNELSKPVNKTQTEYIHSGASWVDDGVSFVCLHPDPGVSYSSANASSACYLVSCDGVSFLFTGDVEKEGEDRLAENMEKLKRLSGQERRVDILKVAHHGSRYSTGERLLEMISPSCGVISCGRKNRYGHPHEELTDRLSRAETTVFRTDELGAVTVYVRRKNYTVKGYLENR